MKVYKEYKSWKAKKFSNTKAGHFAKILNQKYAGKIEDFHQLYDWSVKNSPAFWWEFAQFAQINFKKKAEHCLNLAPKIYDCSWFPGSRLNFCENLLGNKKELKQAAIIFHAEDKYSSEISFSDLYIEVGKAANFLQGLGVKKGDRIVALLPNIPDAIIFMLASSSLGAIWSSCSPDFGVSSVVDRFSQLQATVFLCSNYYLYRSKYISCETNNIQIAKALKCKNNILINYPGFEISSLKHELFINYADYNYQQNTSELHFEALDFHDPLLIMFSSGSTGKPKCIIHSVGGTLLEHLKEHQLHFDIENTDRVFYQTSTSWMMWNWLLSCLASQATIILYDGFPLLEDAQILWRIAEEDQITIFGTNAKYLALLEKSKLTPKNKFKLNALRAILSTGSVLSPDSFDYVYAEIKSDLLLASISGGTDIIGCFALGSTSLAVYRSQLQTRSLALDVQVWNESGLALKNSRGELVCCNAFPSMPIGFWGDDHQRSSFINSYFSTFDGVWRQGDFVELTDQNGMVFFGRSDSILKPGGVRIGSAEISNIVDQLQPVAESVAISHEINNDPKVVLFVKLKNQVDSAEECEKLKESIKKDLAYKASRYHVPSYIFFVEDLPRTKNGKISESAIRDILRGRLPKNLDALLNSEILESYKVFRDQF